MSVPVEIPAFEITDRLPSGTTVLEASAGTGKTWTIGALVTRYVAEGHATVDQILVITFGRAASQEMRDRVREQLVAAEAALHDPAAARAGADPLLALLATASAPELMTRRARLRAALADFDAATIATTHQFCQTVLRSLGTTGDSDGSAELVEDVTQLRDQIVDDLYLAAVTRDSRPPFSRAEAQALARVAVDDPQAVLVPAGADPRSVEARRVRFALEVRRRLASAKRERAVLGFDDLISDLVDSLTPEDSPARALMRERWRIVLVDEFQDTDPEQWRVLELAFHGHGALVLIGDPKQAIYAFRGGDIVTYLRAVAVADDHRTLRVNWRSDRPLVEALQATFAGAELGDPRITVGPVTARRPTSRLTGLPRPAPFRLKVLTRHDAGGVAEKPLAVGDARAAIARDLAGDIAELLASGATFATGDVGNADGEGGTGVRPLQAGDIAVLVAFNSHADEVQRALTDRGIASVLGSGTNVLTSEAADAWLTFLEALANPGRSGYVRAAALTDFFGHDATELAIDGDALTDRVATRLRELDRVLRERGVAAVYEALAGELGRRVLARVGGARLLTDLRHVAHLLHEVELRDRLGPAALLHWLHEQRLGGGESSELTRRLDSDTSAVQVHTIHRSKGLQYPVVYLPFLFDRWQRQDPMALFHDEEGVRTRDVGGNPLPEHPRAADDEDAAEAMRLAYVAMTRAQCQLVAWWAPTRNAAHAGLHRLLFRPDAGSGRTPREAPVPGDATALEVLRGWESRGGPSVEPLHDVPPARRRAPGKSPALDIRRFERELDTTWRRTSYSALTRLDDHRPADPGVVSERDDEGTTDESQDESLLPEAAAVSTDGADPDPTDPHELLSPMAELPSGTGFGSLVHAVFELADFGATDLPAELLEVCTEQAARWGVPADPALLAAAMGTVASTPLGPLADDLTLARLLTDRQLKELAFELPLDGGDLARAAGGRRTPQLADIAPLLDSTLDPTDPLRPFAERLRAPLLGAQPLRGYLNGSLDLGLRLPDDRFLVVDYKTNWLGRFDAPLTLAGYDPDALTDAMLSGTYPLQALLYCVVMHRFLRWRLPGYDPDRHFGGVLYLYVRGMAGPRARTVDGRPFGVFSWRPPTALVVGLSELLDGGEHR